MKTIRAFIAVHLPPAVVECLAQTGQELARQLPAGSVRWVKPEAMHLTLRFLGDTDPSQLPAIAAALDEIAARQPAFTMQLSKLGCFPNQRRPRVIWAGLSGAESELQALKRAIDQALAPLGWEPETRPFQGHLTLGRVKEQRAVLKLPWGRVLQPEPLPVAAVHLIESQLRPNGPLYTVRYSANLRGA